MAATAAAMAAATAAAANSLQRVLPRTLPGPLSSHNSSALDWGWQGFVAYGCQATVVVVDPVTLQCVQTLSGHTSHITTVVWRSSQHYHQLNAPYSLTLASGDRASQVRVWDVASGKCTGVLGAPQGNKHVAELSWLGGGCGGEGGGEHLLLALYPPHRLVLWDARHQSRLWSKSFTHTLTMMTLDPFHATNLAFLCDGCVVFVDDLHPSRCPSSNGTKFYVATASPASPASPASSPSAAGGGGGGSNTLRRRVRELVLGSEPKARPEDQGSNTSGGGGGTCLQLAFHPGTRGRLLLLYPRELLVLDLAINATVAVVALDRAQSSFTQVVPCWRADAIVALHENGAVSLHERRRVAPTPQGVGFGGEGGDCTELIYDRRCLSDGLRLAKNNSCLSLSVEPVNQTKIVLVLGDGRVLFKELSVPPAPPTTGLHHTESTPTGMESTLTASESTVSGSESCTLTSSSLALADAASLPTNASTLSDEQQHLCDTSSERSRESSGVDSTNTQVNSSQQDIPDVDGLKIREDHFGFAGGGSGVGGDGGAGGVGDGGVEDDEDDGGGEGEAMVPPDLSLSALLDASKHAKPRLLLVGVIPCAPPPPVVVRMCPPLTTRNLRRYAPRLALGDAAGVIHLRNLATGETVRELGVHTCAVRGIEWTSLESVLSFAYQPLTNTQGLVRNELFHVDFKGGTCTALRTASQQESPIIAIRVSYLKQYFLVARKHEPLELWCCRSLQLLRALPVRFPRPTALEWSPTSHVRRAPRPTRSVQGEDDVASLNVLGDYSSQPNQVNQGNREPQARLESSTSISLDTREGLNASHSSLEASTVLSNTGVSSSTGAGTDSDSSFNVSTSPSSRSVTPGSGPTSCATSVDSGLGESRDTTVPSASTATGSVLGGGDGETASGGGGGGGVGSATSSDIRVVKETFMLSDAEGSLYHLSVEGNVISDGVRAPPDASMRHVSSIACKSHLMVLADTDSNLSLWDLSTRHSEHVNTGRGAIRKIRFAPGRDNLKLLVLFADGADVWDMKGVERLGSLKGDAQVRVVDGDWAASDRPVLATADGCLRIMDVTMETSHSPLLSYCMAECVASPYLLSGEAALNLRTLLTHQPWRARYSLAFNTQDGFTTQQLHVIHTWLMRVPATLRRFLVRCGSCLHRAQVAAALFGDQSELRFWTVAAHCLPKLTAAHTQGLEEATSSCSSGTNDSSSGSSSSIECVKSSTGDFALIGGEKRKRRRCLGTTNVSVTAVQPLEEAYDLFCDNESYRRCEVIRLRLHESKAVSGEQRSKLCRQLSMMGERDRAVQLLLDAEPSTNTTAHYTACLRACLVSATHHSPQSSSTIKLVATNLIAASRVQEGVELLCLVGKGHEACGYLQSYGQWDESVWLARCCPHLSSGQRRQLLSKWAHHLLLQGDKEGSVLALLSAGDAWAAVQQLAAHHYHQRAALLLHAAVALTVLPKQLLPEHRGVNDSNAGGNGSGDSGEVPTVVSAAMLTLADNIHRKYTLHLFGLANRPAVAYMCRQMGEDGDAIARHLAPPDSVPP